MGRNLLVLVGVHIFLLNNCRDCCIIYWWSRADWRGACICPNMEVENMGKDYLKIRAKKKSDRIEILDIKCDATEGIEEYEKIFKIPADATDVKELQKFARAIAENSEDVRIFAVEVGADSRVLICAAMDSVLGRSFSYIVRNDYPLSFDVCHSLGGKKLSKYHFEVSQNRTIVRGYAWSDEKWLEMYRLAATSDGGVQWVELEGAQI